MKFFQYENGSCDIIFDENEINIIKEKKCLHLTDESLRHFGNVLVKIVADWQMKFDDNLKKKQTYEDTPITGQ